MILERGAPCGGKHCGVGIFTPVAVAVNTEIILLILLINCLILNNVLIEIFYICLKNFSNFVLICVKRTVVGFYIYFGLNLILVKKCILTSVSMAS